MPVFQYQDGELLANGFRMVGIHNPFRSRVDLQKQGRDGKRDDFTFDEIVRRKKKAPGLNVRLSNRYGYSLQKCRVENMPSFVIWTTNQLITPFLRSIMFEELRNNLGQQSLLVQHMQAVLNLVVAAQDFDTVIVTDPIIAWNFSFPIPVKPVDFNMTGRIRHPSKQQKVVNALLNQYGQIPLTRVAKEVFPDIPKKGHDIDVDLFEESGKVLLLDWHNPFCAAYIRHVCLKHGYKDVIPVGLFLHSPSDFKKTR